MSVVCLSPDFAVCQDCGQVWPVQALDTDNNCPPGRCPQCAGQTCDCFACSEWVAFRTERAWSLTCAASSLRLARFYRERGRRDLAAEFRRQANWAIRRADRFRRRLKGEVVVSERIFGLQAWSFGGLHG